MKRHTDELWPMFQDLCAKNKGTVLEVGSRIVSPGSKSKRELFPNNQYIGFDLYKDENTDIVGDAHKLFQYLSEPVDAIFSLSVLEHLVAPWIFAFQVNRSLKMDGVSFHATHFHWPEHEAPADFYRFSDYGLAALFCPLFGFEVIYTSVFAPAYMDLIDNVNHLGMKEAQCWGGSAILAKKVSSPLVDFGNINMSLIYPVNTRYPV